MTSSLTLAGMRLGRDEGNAPEKRLSVFPMVQSVRFKKHKSILALVTGMFLVPAFSIGTYAQQAESKAEPKTKRAPTRASILQTLQEAASSTNALKDTRSRAWLLLAVASARAKAGEQASARATFQQATQAADTIENLENRVYALEDIAVAQIDSNDRPAGLATMRHASEVAATISD